MIHSFAGPESSGNNVELSARQHEFPFQFTLPMNIPHSFKDKYGRIEYYLKAVIDKAWGFDNKCKLPLNVTGTLNLDFVPNAKVFNLLIYQQNAFVKKDIL